VTELRSRAAEFEKAGARLAVIGNGWPKLAKAFAERNQLPPSMTLLTDPSRAAYQAAGLRRSALLTLGPWAWLPFLRTLLRGFIQRRKAGDYWQQGGALVIAPGGRVLYRHVSWHPGDQASPVALLKALTA
jgi:hypothetical protein